MIRRVRAKIAMQMAPLLLLVVCISFGMSSGQLLTSKNTTLCSSLYKFNNKQYRTNIFHALDELANATEYKTVMKGNNASDTVFGLLQCRGDIGFGECKACASTAIKSLNDSCIRNSTKGGRAQEQMCFLRYEDHYFFSNYTSGNDSPLVNCSSNIRNSSEYLANVDTGLQFLRNQVPESLPDGFIIATAGNSPSNAYVLGQCIRELSVPDCTTCMDKARASLSNTCSGRDGGVSYLAECSMQYDSFKFFGGFPRNANTSASNLSARKGNSKRLRNVGIIVGVVGAILLAVLVIVVSLTWRRRKKADDLQSTLYRGPVTFPYQMLKDSTANFDESHKLGAGGFGVVYKGYFPDGSQVAVKKLTVMSEHGELQFLNEVKAISSVQHRNLVKLLGCSMEGTERLLVYEFLKNNSLENSLFGTSENLLDWETRYNILLGTARGLAYLHDDSQIRIVHRDIKPSNILLDEFYEAKISDFGLARLFESTHQLEVLTTKVAGTYGYMAPEYALHGQLSDKIDVYSFGIVVLETVSGRRNRERLLLDEAWQLHAETGGRFDALVDPKLENKAPKDQVLQLVTVALMCTHNVPQGRPTMPHVVAMLSGYSNVYIPENISPLAISFKSSDSKGSSSGVSNDSQQLSSFGPR